jgi:hypothetical protein
MKEKKIAFNSLHSGPPNKPPKAITAFKDPDEPFKKVPLMPDLSHQEEQIEPKSLLSISDEKVILSNFKSKKVSVKVYGLKNEKNGGVYTKKNMATQKVQGIAYIKDTLNGLYDIKFYIGTGINGNMALRRDADQVNADQVNVDQINADQVNVDQINADQIDHWLINVIDINQPEIERCSSDPLPLCEIVVNVDGNVRNFKMPALTYEGLRNSLSEPLLKKYNIDDHLLPHAAIDGPFAQIALPSQCYYTISVGRSP